MYVLCIDAIKDVSLSCFADISNGPFFYHYLDKKYAPIDVQFYLNKYLIEKHNDVKLIESLKIGQFCVQFKQH